MKGFAPNRFSYNSAHGGGRCEACEGRGMISVEMHFLSDVWETCEVCKGKRYNQETLAVEFKGKNIADVLNMRIDEACEFFKDVPKIVKKLQVLLDVGLGYLRLGQSATTLSGGEAQRMKLAAELSKGSGRKGVLYLLDEPTTGLDPQTRLSVWNLVNSLRAKTGMTVFLTTHYMEEAEKATYVVILNHGDIIAQGSPTDLKNAYSGDYVVIYQKECDEITTRLRQEGRKFHYNHDGKNYRVVVKDASDALTFLESHKDILNDFEVEKGSMDDVFLNVTGVREIMEEKDHE
jgi:excinuclease UvrABC ATPase subunit